VTLKTTPQLAEKTINNPASLFNKFWNNLSPFEGRPASAMNRLFGSKSTAPKPTLGSAIQNVRRPESICHNLPSA